jgi:hypothetical protein
MPLDEYVELPLSACSTPVLVQLTPPAQAPPPASTEVTTEATMPTKRIKCMGAKCGDSLSRLYPWPGANAA